MKNYLFILLFFNLIGFSQNRETSLAIQIQYGIYSYMNDSLGILESDSIPECECSYYIDTKFHTFINKKEKNSPTLDTDILDWVDGDEFEKDIEIINKNSTSKFKGKTNSMYVTVDIKRLWIRYNIFRFKWKIKYLLTITYNLTPIAVD